MYPENTRSRGGDEVHASKQPTIPPAIASHPLANISTPEKLSGLWRTSNGSTVEVAEISRRMEKDGFPELVRSWNRFVKLRIDPAQLQDAYLDREKEAHKAPFGAHPWISYAGYTVVALGGAWISANLYLDSASTVTRLGISAWAALNCGFLGLYSGAMIKRYFVKPFEKLMALELGRMLSKENFRKWFEEQPRTKNTDAALRAAGVSANWDNPKYRRRYEVKREAVTEVPILTPREIISSTLKEFLGSMDQVKRKFQPGRYLPDLIDGKRTIAAFVAKFAPELELSRQERLSTESGRDLLRYLLEHSVKPDSEGARILARRIATLDAPDAAQAGIIDVQIWQRDPWKDLTHQEEFFSSASLRGSKLMGRGAKGRLGTFEYLHNRSIVALDFSMDGKRIVRTRLGAALAPAKGGGKVPILFVDGVEGSGALPQRAVRTAIEAYAQTCGFKAVLYNSFVHNQTPLKFVHYLERAEVPRFAVPIRYFDDSKREYLDSFGIPLDPFEYARPRGVVVGHLSNFENTVEIAAEDPRVQTKAGAWVKRNALFLLVGQTAGFEVGMASVTQADYLLPALGVGAVLFGINHWFQRRSLGVGRKSKTGK